jgi:hypothetical protein
MNMKPRHYIWLLYGIGVAAYAAFFHLFAKTDEQLERGGHFVGVALVFLVPMIIGTLSEEFAERRKKKRDED